MRLRNKVAVITGAGSGIGRATALLFSEDTPNLEDLDFFETVCRNVGYNFQKFCSENEVIEIQRRRCGRRTGAFSAGLSIWRNFAASAGWPLTSCPLTSRMPCGRRLRRELGRLVGAGRFELPTSASRTRRATKLRYAPTNDIIGCWELIVN